MSGTMNGKCPDSMYIQELTYDTSAPPRTQESVLCGVQVDLYRTQSRRLC